MKQEQRDGVPSSHGCRARRPPPHLLLLVDTEMGPMKTAEARTCQSQSHKFKGPCFSDSNCASVCRTENFPRGQCNTHYVDRKCYCERDC